MRFRSFRGRSPELVPEPPFACKYYTKPLFRKRGSRTNSGFLPGKFCEPDFLRLGLPELLQNRLSVFVGRSLLYPLPIKKRDLGFTRNLKYSSSHLRKLIFRVQFWATSWCTQMPQNYTKKLSWKHCHNNLLLSGVFASEIRSVESE